MLIPPAARGSLLGGWQGLISFLVTSMPSPVQPQLDLLLSRIGPAPCPDGSDLVVASYPGYAELNPATFAYATYDLVDSRRMEGVLFSGPFSFPGPSSGPTQFITGFSLGLYAPGGAPTIWAADFQETITLAHGQTLTLGDLFLSLTENSWLKSVARS